MEPIQAVLAIVALVRAGKVWDALPMALRLVAFILESLPVMKAVEAASAGVREASGRPACLDTPSDCCDRLEAVVNPPEGQPKADDGRGLSPTLEALLPILLALFDLLRKQLGL